MRYSKNKSKNSTKGEDENASASFQMELELIGLKAKNADLIKAHTKVVQENAEMRSQIYSLQADLLKVQTKYNNIQSYVINLQQNLRKCTPNLINILNLFVDVTSNQPLKNVQNNSITSYTPSQTKLITQSVQPHAVNGTVLNLNPTITLTRLSTSNQSSIESFNNSNVHINIAPSISNLANDSIDNPEIEETENTEKDDFKNVYVSSRRVNALSKDSLSEPEDEISNVNQNSCDEQSLTNRLSIIPEESYYEFAKQQCRVSEVNICLSPLSRSDIENALNGTSSSTVANLNDTSLNVDPNLEGMNNRASKRLKPDIVFSPYTNSTRLEYDGSYFDQSLSVQIKRLATPSSSAMGDIEKQNNSKLDIFTDLPQNTTGISPISPIPPTKSMLTSRKGSGLYKDQSPRTSRENIRGKRSKIKSMSSGSEHYKSAIIVLERLENILTDDKIDDLTSRWSGEKLEGKTQKDTENKSKKEKLKSRSKSPKCQHKEEFMENKLNKIKSRLSQCMSDTEDLTTEDLSQGRPKRAARPTNLKDASLKKKLRRL